MPHCANVNLYEEWKITAVPQLAESTGSTKGQRKFLVQVDSPRPSNRLQTFCKRATAAVTSTRRCSTRLVALPSRLDADALSQPADRAIETHLGEAKANDFPNQSACEEDKYSHPHGTLPRANRERWKCIDDPKCNGRKHGDRSHTTPAVSLVVFQPFHPGSGFICRQRP